MILIWKSVEQAQQQKDNDKFRLIDGRFVNIPGKSISPVASVSRTQFILWSLMERTRKTKSSVDQIEVVYEIPESPPSFPFHALLPFIVFYLLPEQKRPANWFQANKSQNYGNISFSDLKKELESGIGILFQKLSQSNPDNLPDFLAKMDTP